MSDEVQKATFGGGCFWCTEEIYRELKGVSKVTSGYAGGKVANPTYEQVSSGMTGHAEAIQIEYDPSIISYEILLEVFFSSHDPTQLNRQGHDVGTQYRSVVFYHDENQSRTAETFIKNLTDQKAWSSHIVTAVEPFSNFYPAESYHQNYYQQNTAAPYCQIVINPKLEKFRKEYEKLLKTQP